MKKAAILGSASTLGIVLVALLFLLVGSAGANLGIRYVGPGGNCGGAMPCYANVQAAVDAALPNDEIRVAAGVYTDVHARPRRDTAITGVVTQTVYLSKTLTIRGGYNANFTAWNPAIYRSILNPQGHGRVLYITGEIAPVIRGLHLTRGYATGLAGYEYYGIYDAGGGVYIMTATTTLDNNWISGGRAEYGGGIFLNNSISRLSNNTIYENSVGTGGGGLTSYHGSLTLDSNQVLSNTSSNLGGGLYLFATDATIRDNLIKANNAHSHSGGVSVASCDPAFIGNIIASNTADHAGGMYFWYSHSLLTNNAIIDNHSSYSGSGIKISGSQPRFWHTTIARNIGGGNNPGVYITDAGTGSHSTVIMTNTILVNHAVGMQVDSGSIVRLNGLLWFSTPVTITQQAGATVDVNHAYTGDPSFSPDGYHLRSGSLARNKGLPSIVVTDIDGQPRSPGIPDLGADEFWAPGFPKYIYLPVIFRGP